MSELDLPKRFLHWYAVFVAAGVLVLICSGGLVTSHGAGMAVPDWPNSFGYNMFLFPLSHWVGGVFFEHTHRLIASGVGLLTIALCVFTLVVEQRAWVKWLAGIAVLAVIIQGVLGGLRVTEHNARPGTFSWLPGARFFCLVATIALVTSRFWRRIERAARARRNPHPAVLGCHSHRDVVYSIGVGCVDAALAYGIVDSRFPGCIRRYFSAARCRVDCSYQRGPRSHPICAAHYFRTYSLAVRSSRMGRLDRYRPFLSRHRYSPQPTSSRSSAFCRRFLDPACCCAVSPWSLDDLE